MTQLVQSNGQYGILARFYDRLMDDINYDVWAHRIVAIIRTHHGGDIESLHVLDVGCGTGNVTLALSRQGLRLTGIDRSPEMLAVAETKFGHDRSVVTFHCQDVRRLALDTRFDVVVAACDTLSHLVTLGDLESAFHSVRDHLVPGGLFVFDVNTEYKLREVYGDNIFIEELDDLMLIWGNQYEPREHMVEMDMVFFVSDPSDDFGNRRYVRYDESYRERAHSDAEVRDVAESAGFDVLGAYDGYSPSAPHDRSERISYVARKRR